MHHALSGHLLWTTQLPFAESSSHNGLVDAALMPPTFSVSSTTSIGAAAPDAIVMDRSGRVSRLAGVNGAPVWLSDAAESLPETSSEESPIAIKLHVTPTHTFIVSLVPHQPKLRLFSSTQTYSLNVKVVASGSGALVGAYDVPNSMVEMNSVSSKDNTAGNVVVLGQDSNGSHTIKPKLVWLQTDGSVRSLLLKVSSEQGQEQIEPASVEILNSKTASRDSEPVLFHFSDDCDQGAVFQESSIGMRRLLARLLLQAC